MNRTGLLEFIKKEKRDLLLLSLLAITFMSYGLINRDWGNARDLSISLDAQVPLFPPSVYVYHLWAPTLFLVLAILFVRKREAYRAMLLSIFVAGIFAFSTFILFTTIIPRPEIVTVDLATWIIKTTYSIDPPYSGFPSFHVLTTCIFLFYYLKFGKSKPFKIALFAWSILICATTVLTKQHVLLDIAGGLLYTPPSVIIGNAIEKRLPRKYFAGQELE